MKSKKKTAKKVAPKFVKRKIAKGKTILYLHVQKETKSWLTSLSKKQIGKTSQSNIAEKIFSEVKKHPKLLASAMIKS